jgi:hypothetical protein
MAGAFERPRFLWSITWVIIICCSRLLACCLVIVAMHIWGASTWSILAPVYIFLHMVALVNARQPSSPSMSWSYRATLFCGCDFLREVCFALSNFVMITRTIPAYTIGAVHFVVVTCSKSAWSIPTRMNSAAMINLKQHPTRALEHP